jgi:hypothetical protein
MIPNKEELQRVIAEMAILIDKEMDPEPEAYALFFQHPEYAFHLIELLNNLEEAILNEGPPIYSACIFCLDVCVAQMQAAAEANNKTMHKSLTELMDRLAALINTQKHTLSYWLPVLNAFYEVQVELTQKLKDAYFLLANQDDDGAEVDEFAHLTSIRDLILEMSDLSIFSIVENFFAQSYAMPEEFFSDLVVDLYNIPEGHEIALLTLLHPKKQVRDIVVATFDDIIDTITLSSTALSRLQVIMHWYPKEYHAQFERWMKVQRKKGVVFEPDPVPAKMYFKATEVDGSGSQGIFIQIKINRKSRLSGLLLKHTVGLKDAWITPFISVSEISEYYHQAFEESVTLREVDLNYFALLVEHFMAVTIAHGDIPHLHFLEIQEALGVKMKPQLLDLDDLFAHLGIEISPFTQEVIDESLQRSKSWLKNKPYTESWYIESPNIDKIVNHNSSFVDGVKVCKMQDSMVDVFKDVLEEDREKWQFHFLWVALWLKSKRRSNEKSWQDSFVIAHLIREGTPLNELPVMQEICHQTVVNSIETMQERRTHLNQE